MQESAIVDVIAGKEVSYNSKKMPSSTFYQTKWFLTSRITRKQVMYKKWVFYYSSHLQRIPVLLSVSIAVKLKTHNTHIYSISIP